MKKLFYTFLATVVCCSIFGAELHPDDVKAAIEQNSVTLLENARPARTEYSEEDLAKKEALIKSLGLSYDKKIFDPNFSVSDYSTDIKYTAENGFVAEKMSLDELDKLFDQILASNVSVDIGKVANGLTDILMNAVNISGEQVELVFAQYEKLFDKADVDSDTYNKDAINALMAIVQTTASMNTSAEGYTVRAKQNAEYVSFTDPNQKWVKETIKDPYIWHAEEYIDFDSELWAAWRKIFESKPEPVEKIGYKVPQNGRFIFEVWMPSNSAEKENLIKELDFMKSRGYIGVVMMWDGKSNYKELVSLQEEIKAKGFRIWLGFSPYKGQIHPAKINKEEKMVNVSELSMSTFVEPIYYREGLKALAVNSEAFLMGWRRTSIHLNTQNEEWQNYTMRALRDGNPEIGFIGEFYYGENGNHPYGNLYVYGQYANYRENYDAVLLVNYGYISVNPKWAIATARRVVGQEPQLVCVIQGIGPGYISRPGHVKKTKKRTIAQYRRINELLEDRFLRAGFDAVCGLAGDGLNAPIYPDDMSLSTNHKPSEEKF